MRFQRASADRSGGGIDLVIATKERVGSQRKLFQILALRMRLLGPVNH